MLLIHIINNISKCFGCCFCCICFILPIIYNSNPMDKHINLLHYINFITDKNTYIWPCLIDLQLRNFCIVV